MSGVTDQRDEHVAGLWIPGIAWMTRGRVLTGVLTLLIFCYGITGVICAAWWAAGPQRLAPSALSTTPMAGVGLWLYVSREHPGTIRGKSSLVVGVREDRITVEALDPIIPSSSRLITRRFLFHLALCASAVLMSLISSSIGRWRFRVAKEQP